MMRTWLLGLYGALFVLGCGASEEGLFELGASGKADGKTDGVAFVLTKDDQRKVVIAQEGDTFIVRLPYDGDGKWLVAPYKLGTIGLDYPPHIFIDENDEPKEKGDTEMSIDGEEAVFTLTVQGSHADTLTFNSARGTVYYYHIHIDKAVPCCLSNKMVKVGGEKPVYTYTEWEFYGPLRHRQLYPVFSGGGNCDDPFDERERAHWEAGTPRDEISRHNIEGDEGRGIPGGIPKAGAWWKENCLDILAKKPQDRYWVISSSVLKDYL